MTDLSKKENHNLYAITCQSIDKAIIASIAMGGTRVKLYSQWHASTETSQLPASQERHGLLTPKENLNRIRKYVKKSKGNANSVFDVLL